MTKFYKVLNSDLTHHGFQYRLGLNVDTIPFDPTGGECGGLYYTDAEHIAEFLSFGCFIADVEIPVDAKIYQSPKGNKYKADKIIIIRYCDIKDHPLLKDPDWCKASVCGENLILWYITNPEPELCLAAVKRNGMSLMYVRDQTVEICLVAVKQNGYALQYVFNQTEEICLEAVKQNGWALMYVKDQTDEICLEAVKQNGLALKYVRNQTPELCVLAISKDIGSLKYFNKKDRDVYKCEVTEKGWRIEFTTDEN